MNSAAEIVVRWHLDQQAAPADFADELVATLYEGCAKGEADSIELRDRFILTVEGTEREAPWDSVIDMAIALHRELEGVEKAIHNLGLLKTISEAVENVPENAFSKRITMFKIKDCIAKLKP